jgi:DNA-directed RNA polymerase subunit M/transcription elongation factor TFIIS
MAIALKGAIIIEQKGSTLVYKAKCEKCGNVAGTTISTPAPSKGGTYTYTYHCTKCGNSQRIEIKG